MTSSPHAGVGPEASTRIRQQEVVAELGQQALETDDLDRLMHDAAVAVAETLDNEYAKVLELLPSGDEVFLRQGVGWRDGLVGNATVPTDLDSQAGYTLLSEEPIVVDDLRTEDRFSGPELLTSHDVVSGVSVVIGSVEDPWGVLGTHTTEYYEFTRHDANFVQSVANVLASAIEETDTKRALRERERDLKETKRQLELATKAASVGLWTWDIRENVVTADDYLAETYGIDPEDADGAPMEQFYEPIHEEDTERTWKRLQRAVEETGELEAEYRVRDADGDLKWVIARGQVSHDEDGDPVRMHGAISDITERKKRERDLETYKQYTSEILDAIDDIFYVLDENGSLKRWNESVPDVTGYGDDEIETMHALDFFDEADHEPIANAIAEGFETGTTHVEASLITKDGASIPYEFVANALENPDGNPVLVGIGRDITNREEKREKLEETIEKLEKSNERLEQFAYAASHDLQEPLRMVSSYLQLIERRYADELDEDGEEFLEFAVDGADRMRAMIGALLEYSRIETRSDPLEPVDLNCVFEDVQEDLQMQINGSNAQVTTDDLPLVEGDESQLRQVFQNLLSNAITYSGDEPPRIHVEAERRGRKWTISVRDEGIGIAPSDQERVFDVFQRLHSREEHSGTGIGLALCQRIIERHGGRIWVDSEPGETSTFSFTLPAAE